MTARTAPGYCVEVLLEPEHALGVEVVGGLVEQQQVGLLQQQLGQRDAALLTTGEVRDARRRRAGVRRASIACSSWESRSHASAASISSCRVPISASRASKSASGSAIASRDLVEAVELALDRADALLHVLEHGLGLVELGLLHEDADACSRALSLRLAVGGGVEPGHDLEDRGLAGAVRADHADLRPGRNAMVTSSRMSLSPTALRARTIE